MFTGVSPFMSPFCGFFTTLWPNTAKHTPKT